MPAHKNTKRNNFKSVEELNAYFALKSKNEIYYQMASIFKEINNDKEISSQTAFIDLLSVSSSENSIGKLL